MLSSLLMFYLLT